MSPEQRAAVAAALLDTLPAEQLLAQRLEQLGEAVTLGGEPGLAEAMWRGVNVLHDSLVAIAAAAAAGELAAQAEPPSLDERRAAIEAGRSPLMGERAPDQVGG